MKNEPKFKNTQVSFGFNLAVGMSVFILGGYWLDQHQGNGSRWTIIGTALGFVYGAYEVYKYIINSNDEKKD